ncbi:MAG: Sua5/YciO/YrdC/YwlC family protein [Sulfurifustaceae bacterium]
MRRDVLTPATPRVDPGYTEQQVVDAVGAIRRGGLVLLKGDIGYGLFGISERAIRKMYEIKGRPHSNPCIVIGNLDVLADISRIPDPEIGDWIRETASWTTLAVVLPVNPQSRLLAKLPAWVYAQTVTNATVAAFLNTGEFLEKVIARAFREEILFVGSSANLSSRGNIFDFAELPAHFVQGADFYLDHGKARYANPERKATTIVNFTNWTVKRRGVNWEKIEPSFWRLKQSLDGRRNPTNERSVS